MAQILPHDMQHLIEERYARHHLERLIKEAVNDIPELKAKQAEGVQLLTDWLALPHEGKKKARLDQLDILKLPELVMEVITAIAYCTMPTLYVSVTSQLSVRLGFDDRADGIRTVAEIIAVLAVLDIYDMDKASTYASVTVTSRIPLPEDLIHRAQQMEYTPPMVVQPRDLTHNFESPYLSYNECQILGPHNGHEGDICLDVINTQNRVALSLDMGFLCKVDELPSYELDTPNKGQLWDQFLKTSREIYLLLHRAGNRFYLTNRVDKRGRMYAQGYHVTTQGTPFKKAMIELADAEVVQGVPHGN